MMAIPESGPSVEVNIYNDGDKREGKAGGGYSMMSDITPTNHMVNLDRPERIRKNDGTLVTDSNLLAGPDTPEFRAKQAEHYANVARESQRVGEDEDVILSEADLNKLELIKQGEALRQRGKELEAEAENKRELAQAKKIQQQGELQLEGLLKERDQNSGGGLAGIPNIVSSAPDMKTVRQMDYLSTTEGQQASEAAALKLNEGGMPMPPELTQQEMPTEEAPVDTYPNVPPEEMAEVEASQLPDDEMEDGYLDFIISESLSGQEQQYLMESLEADPQLSSIIDKLVLTASEFTGEGEVDGPGTGVSDSIPARLSDGEFVFTKKATDQLGADNLQTMMDDAERAYDGGLQKFVLGGAVGDSVLGGAVRDITPIEDDKLMYGDLKQQAEMKKQMMYANRMPSIIGER